MRRFLPRFLALLVAALASPQALAAYPAAYTWRNVNGRDFTSGVRNQGACSDCWIVMTVSAVEARMEIESGRADWNPNLSEQYPLSCMLPALTCTTGGNPETTLDFLEATGTVEEGCFAYKASVPACPATSCPDSSAPLSFTKVSGHRMLYLPSTADLKQEIFDHGPVASIMDVYTTLYDYTSGVYTNPGGTSIGGKTILLAGWGTLGGVDYWEVMNSWGTGWGDQGWFKIRIGDCRVGEWAWVVDGVAGCQCADGDGDGYPDAACADPDCPARDCDDTDPAVHPGATERCNDVDDDCDGEVDEGCASKDGLLGCSCGTAPGSGLAWLAATAFALRFRSTRRRQRLDDGG